MSSAEANAGPIGAKEIDSSCNFRKIGDGGCRGVPKICVNNRHSFDCSVNGNQSPCWSSQPTKSSSSFIRFVRLFLMALDRVSMSSQRGPLQRKDLRFLKLSRWMV